ncbi:tetratricopeptide repeat protein [Lentilactobacillus senioris]|uniref:tetratricopeptide repeat protein n=1 Tax=Lentilactobacillus senioris TaxID=931534 RepID=UPI000A71D968
MTENKTTKREQQTQKMNQLVHELVQKIDRNPEEPQNYYDLATVLVDGNDYEQAEELLMKALGLFDNDEVTVKDKLIYGLANVYYAAEEYPKAIQWFEKITSQQLKTDAYLMLAQSYLALGDNKRSMAFALTAQGKQIMKPEISNLIGDNLLALGGL